MLIVAKNKIILKRELAGPAHIVISMNDARTHLAYQRGMDGHFLILF